MTLPSLLTGRFSRWIETTQDQLGVPNLNKLGFASSAARHTGCDAVYRTALDTPTTGSSFNNTSNRESGLTQADDLARGMDRCE
jgi:hypothetical protein